MKKECIHCTCVNQLLSMFDLLYTDFHHLKDAIRDEIALPQSSQFKKYIGVGFYERMDGLAKKAEVLKTFGREKIIKSKALKEMAFEVVDTLSLHNDEEFFVRAYSDLRYFYNYELKILVEDERSTP